MQVDKPGAALPQSADASHYYAARDTDAWPLRSEGENEKLLFYRGLAYFGVDLKAVVSDTGVLLRNDGADTVSEAILFENHAGKTGYQVIHNLREPVSIRFSELTGATGDVQQIVEEELVEMGLYRKEAQAMIKTWQDSWFEEGSVCFTLCHDRT